jgi:hypothetical protein
MRYVRMTVIMTCLTAALFACQSAESGTLVPQEPVGQTEAPGSLPARTPSQPATPLPTQEDTAMAPATPPNEAAERMVTLVKQHLAQRLNVAADQIVLSDVKPVVWRDAGLGCPKPAVDYIQVETPGYNILLEVDGKTYRYHTDETKRFVQCNR